MSRPGNVSRPGAAHRASAMVQNTVSVSVSVRSPRSSSEVNARSSPRSMRDPHGSSAARDRSEARCRMNAPLDNQK